MPVYNTREDYLREAIDSILRQTFTDFEFIIVNDGSTNPAVEKTIKSYSDTRIRYFKTPNAGIANALNYGIRKASGEFIARMDSDDISLPARFEKQVAFLDSNPDISIVGTDAAVFPADGFLRYDARPGYLDVMRQCPFAHPTVMWRRQDFIKHGLFYNSEHVAEDLELWSRAAKDVRFANIQEVLLKYRMHDASLSVTLAGGNRRDTENIRNAMMDFLTRDSEIRNKIWNILFPPPPPPPPRYWWMAIPVIKVRNKAHKKIYRLFGFIPIWVEKKKDN